MKSFVGCAVTTAMEERRSILKELTGSDTEHMALELGLCWGSIFFPSVGPGKRRALTKILYWQQCLASGSLCLLCSPLRSASRDCAWQTPPALLSSAQLPPKHVTIYVSACAVHSFPFLTRAYTLISSSSPLQHCTPAPFHPVYITLVSPPRLISAPPAQFYFYFLGFFTF